MSLDDVYDMRDFLVRYDKGELTAEENKLVDVLKKENNGEELTEEELELVSGGISTAGWIGIGAGAAAGTAVVGAVATKLIMIALIASFAW